MSETGTPSPAGKKILRSEKKVRGNMITGVSAMHLPATFTGSNIFFSSKFLQSTYSYSFYSLLIVVSAMFLSVGIQLPSYNCANLQNPKPMRVVENGQFDGKPVSGFILRYWFSGGESLCRIPVLLLT
jgi:hypothetical protein